PGTVNLNVSSTASVPAGVYRIIVTGTGNGKTHSTSVGYLVGKNYILTGTNRQINNLSYMIDNVNYTATHSFTWDLNSTHTLSAVSPQTIASIRYVFSSWSDGGAQSHQVAITPQMNSFNVNYGIQYKLISNNQPSGVPATIAAGNQFYDSASTVNL